MDGRKTSAGIPDPAASAGEAGLRYTTDRRPGILRVGSFPRFRYRDQEGGWVRNPAVLQRIRSLVIPPNWKHVWICASSRGHLQVTARDARGRKQYRYHPEYRATRDQAKYDKMLVFGNLLPQIRRRVQRDLTRPGLPKERVLAAIVRLMDLTQVRVGNAEYARDNGSYGLTTLRNRHARVKGPKIELQFRGKSGQVHSIALDDSRLAAIVRRCRDLPGYELFEYIDDNGQVQDVDSSMVNEYLKSITGYDITAKDFRTWHGSVHAALRLGKCAPASSIAQCRRNVVSAIKAVAEQLGNRPATCRKFYVHPVLISAYEDGSLLSAMAAEVTPRYGLSRIENALLALLHRACGAGRLSRRGKAKQTQTG